MGIFYFPCNFVYWRKVPEHEKFKNEILKILHDNSHFMHGHHLIYNGITTQGDKTFQNKLKSHHEMFNSVVWDSIEELVKKLNDRENFQKIPLGESIVKSCWISQYNKNASVSCHNHSPEIPQIQHFIDGKMFRSTFSMIYIINDDNERNQTEFLEPSMFGNNISKSAETRFNTRDVEEIGEGTVLIFPSNLYHQVNSIQRPGRIIMSFNILSTFN
jgi:predicted 2-oxoglutarate/Fe(II)-dependent dioxygenase YbiX